MPSADYPFYGGTPPHVRGSDTSRAAAQDAKAAAATKRALVLAYIRSRSFYGATRDEVGLALDLGPQTATPRVRELVLEHFETGGGVCELYETRATSRGKQAHVCVVPEFVKGRPVRPAPKPKHPRPTVTPVVNPLLDESRGPIEQQPLL